MNSVLIAITVLSFSSANELQINDIISALEKAAIFYDNNYGQFNLDGVAGFRVLQALLEDTLKRWSLSGPEADSQYAKVEDLAIKVGFTVMNSIKEIKLQESAYFDAFEPLLQANFWTFRPEWTQTDSKLVYPERRITDCFNEKSSDQCFSQLLGTWKEYRLSCLETIKCRRLMTTVNCSDYSLSHQLLYLIFAEIKNCTNVVGPLHPNSRNLVSTQHLKKIYCANMMQGNLEIEDEGFPIYQQDIFMENLMLCGMIGYSDFYKDQWLKAILSWQHPKGCYEEDERFLQSIEREQNAFTAHKRVKRRDVLLQGYCSSHKTGVAVGSLGNYLRFYGISQNIIEPPKI